MNIDFTCTKDWIFQDVPHQIWEAISADGNSGSVLVTRLLHNKVSFYTNNFLRCYLSYLSPDFITYAFTAIGLLLFLFGLYQAIRERKVSILALLLLAPLFPLFSFPPNKAWQGLFLYGILGLITLYGAKKLSVQMKELFHAT